MRRILPVFLLPVLLFLLPPAPVAGQYAPRRGDDLSGTYQSTSDGATCYVTSDGRSYLFVNDQGQQARFVWVAPRRLQWAGGGWDPNIVVTVDRDRWGRRVLRFDAPYTPTGTWVSVD